MNIKKRFVITNTVTFVIPVIITIITAFIFIFISSTIFNKDVSYDNFKKLVQIRTQLFDTADSISGQNSENVESAEFQSFLTQRLSNFGGKSIILKGNKVVFSTGDMNKIDIEKTLEEIKSKSINRSVEIGGIPYFLDNKEFKFKDGTEGNAILLAPSDNGEAFTGTFAAVTFFIFLLSFTGINIIMSWLFSKKILKPVTLLKNAAAEISSGNLQCEIVEDGDEEIRELCRDFERMRLQLKDSVNMKMKYDDNRTMLVSSISHDLKTPITSIKGYVEGILDGVANTPEKLEEYLKTIYSKAEHIDFLIDDLLLYSKLDLNQIPFNFEKTNIIKYLEYCVMESAPELQKTGIKIDLENGLKLSYEVMLDRERMKRVIMNIIENSRKYMDKEQGEINLILRETNSSIIVEIRDNGAGIDNTEVNKIFDRFYRADAARGSKNGSGLGLAISRQIVEGHKGKIWAVSHGNEGTSILISLAKIADK